MDQDRGTRRNIGEPHSAQINFAKILVGVKNYGDIQGAIAKTIVEMRAQGIDRFGFVSGPIANTTETNKEVRRKLMKEKMEQMRRTTKELQEENKFPIFSSTDIFDEAWQGLAEMNLSPEERSLRMEELFRRILESGVTDIFMMKDWRNAPGAMDEYNTSMKLGITIHDLDPEEKKEQE